MIRCKSFQQNQIIIQLLLNRHMTDPITIFRPCLSAEKVILTPRLTQSRKISTTRRAITHSKQDLSVSSHSPPSKHLPVHNYSFISRRYHTESDNSHKKSTNFMQFSQHTCRRNSSDENNQKIKRMTSIKMNKEVTFDAFPHPNSARPQLQQALMIKSVRRKRPGNQKEVKIKSRRQSLCGKQKSNFLQFYKSRKRSIKASHSPVSIEGMLLRFLQIRKSNMQNES